jgi:hypothetical protein
LHDSKNEPMLDSIFVFGAYFCFIYFNVFFFPSNLVILGVLKSCGGYDNHSYD